MALEMGAPAVANVALIGFAAASPALTLPLETIEGTLTEVASRQLEVNLKALHLGYDAGRAAQGSALAQPGTEGA
jgi:Pyruvate/2-oxoacid:ferredoxin oxidoreductase gamma subunit